MSAQPHDAADADDAVVECPPCGLAFAPASSPGEAEHLAAIHNSLHHGGIPSAVLGDTQHAGSPDAVETGSPVLQLGWVLDLVLLDDARAQAVPFAGDETASDRAWSARVDSAVQGMDVLDPGGVDVWAEAHARSAEPHLAEAELVAVWETWIRTEYASTAEPAAAAAEDTAVAEGWAL